MAIRTWSPRRHFDRPWIQAPPFDVLRLRGKVRDGVQMQRLRIGPARGVWP